MTVATPSTVDSTMLNKGARLLEWTGLIHPEHQRSMQWYIIAGTLLLGLALYGIATGAWTMTVACVLLGIAYYLTRNEPAASRSIVIEEAGFEYENSFVPWSECTEFWISHTPHFNELHILRKRGLNREIVIQTNDIDVTLIRTTLSRFLPMRPDHQERVLDQFLRLIKL